MPVNVFVWHTISTWKSIEDYITIEITDKI